MAGIRAIFYDWIRRFYRGHRDFAGAKFEMIIYSDRATVKQATLNDGLFYDSPNSEHPVDEAMQKARDYIREHANHFLEEAYEKIPEARNADEIIY